MLEELDERVCAYIEDEQLSNVKTAHISVISSEVVRQFKLLGSSTKNVST